VPYNLRENAQPAYYLVRQQGRTIGVIARSIDVPYIHLRNVLYGDYPPSNEVRTRLPGLLGVDLKDLFTEDMLARAYRGRARNKK